VPTVTNSHGQLRPDHWKHGQVEPCAVPASGQQLHATAPVRVPTYRGTESGCPRFVSSDAVNPDLERALMDCSRTSHGTTSTGTGLSRATSWDVEPMSLAATPPRPCRPTSTNRGCHS